MWRGGTGAAIDAKGSSLSIESHSDWGTGSIATASIESLGRS